MSPPVKEFQEAVLSWYRQFGRPLPWRQTTDPYTILVSELMLQQTQVDRVIPKYEAWLQRWPTAAALAEAEPAEVIRAWAGLGYNRRALYLQRAARAIIERGSFPATEVELRQLPGIGPYTASAICSFAYNQDVPLVDTNIKRLYQLIVFGDEIEPTESQVLTVARGFLPAGRSRDWHNALMDLGAILSKSRGAKIQQQKLTELFPVVAKSNLPSVSDQPLKRPKQSHFKSSRRYWRGQIITHLRQQSPIARQSLTSLLKALNCPYDPAELLASLAKDGLIRLDPQSAALP